MHLVEMLVSVSIGSAIMSASFGSTCSMYRASSGGENQVIASSLAQQVIDHARSSRYEQLKDLAVSHTQPEFLELYSYPADPENSLFPRPLLRNDDSTTSDLYYQTASKAKTFNGTVQETLSLDSDKTSILVKVQVDWKDARGPHSYKTATTIAENGIHGY